jgi:hypothetical protein
MLLERTSDHHTHLPLQFPVATVKLRNAGLWSEAFIYLRTTTKKPDNLFSPQILFNFRNTGQM